MRRGVSKGILVGLVLGLVIVSAVTVVYLIPGIQSGQRQQQGTAPSSTSTTSETSHTQSTSASTSLQETSSFATSSYATSTSLASSSFVTSTTTSATTSTTVPSLYYPPGPIEVTATGANYQSVVSPPTTGWFTNGQSADMMLLGFGFNNASSSIQFNHPSQVATDGTHMVLADTWNNRVLLWNSIPESANIPPNIVLGQPNFVTNDPGTEMNQLNWPVGVSIADGKLVVADTYNNRILIWSSIPTRNDQPADIQIDGAYPYGPNLGSSALRDIWWPWGIWTDGTKLVLTTTSRGLILIWNSFPTTTNQSADIYIYGGGIGTPRTITSDGNHLIIGDHNACLANEQQQATTFYPIPCNDPTVGTTWFWRSFPTHDNQLPDFYMNEPAQGTSDWMTGQFTIDGRLLLIGTILYEWNAFPDNATVAPNLEVGSWYIPGMISKFTFIVPFNLVVAGSKVMISETYGNKILFYNSIPTDPTDFPDYVVGAPNINANTLDSNYMMGNPIPATDGKSLVVVSDADLMYIWKNIPNESGAHPDYVYNFHTMTLGFSPECAVIHNGTLVVAGFNGASNGPQVFIWNEIPLNGELPDRNYSTIGGVKLGEIHGCAWDNRYFFLADLQNNLVYVWNTLPSNNSTAPLFSIPVSPPDDLSSDGTYLVVSSGLALYIYNENKLSSSSNPVVIGGSGISNGLRGLASDGHLFAADTGFNRLLIWNNITQAVAGGTANVTIGCLGGSWWGYCGTEPMIGASKLFWPASLAFDGHYLWIGELKFSSRLLRFSI